MKKNIIEIVLVVLMALLIYYFMLPPLNLSSPEFWGYLLLVLVFFIFIHFFMKIGSLKMDTIINDRKVLKKKPVLILWISIIGIVFTIILVNIVNSPLFNSKSYYERISVSDGNFEEDVMPADFNKLALLDKDSSSKLGDRVMGQMTDLVSQFTVSDLYTQINYQDKIVRVTPLEYAGMIKYFTNRHNGVEGYIMVNSVSGEASLVRLNQGMKYMPSSMFFENLYRKLRISYPMTIFGDISFEIDDEGKPYWIAQTIKYKGVGLRREVSGVVILDPTTGNSHKYKVEDVPTWVDHVYSPDLIVEQVNDWGQYKNGFWNSIFSQRDVVMTTEGYNYLAMNDDVYLYTGITSVSSDEANVGVILTNMRTKETHFYNVAGAKEYSAMSSAVGKVQQMNYTSTFPLLINLENKPTYLMSLKDKAGLVKMYAFVDYTDYQKVTVTDASEGILKAAQNYLGGIITSDTKEKEITILSIKTAVLDGTTYYYLKDVDDVYRASIKIAEDVLPFLNSEQKITIIYKEGTINEIVEIR